MKQKYGTCGCVAVDKALKKVGTQPLGAYIYRQQATVAEWVVLCPILEVCDKDTCYEVGGRRREPWWRQRTARTQMSATLKEILASARDWYWKSGRRDRGGDDRDAAESEDGAGRNGYRGAGTDTGGSQLGK